MDNNERPDNDSTLYQLIQWQKMAAKHLKPTDCDRDDVGEIDNMLNDLARVRAERDALKANLDWCYKWLKFIDIDGPVTGEDAEDMRRWARLALKQKPDSALIAGEDK